MINGTLSEKEKEYLNSALNIAWSNNLGYMNDRDLLYAAKMQDMIRAVLGLDRENNFTEEAQHEIERSCAPLP